MRQCAHCGHQNADDARFCARCGAPAEVHIDEDRSVYNTPVAPGTIFERKYQVLEEIGRGGMGVVYRGHDLSLDRLVAIKVLPEQFNTDDDVIARFKKEAKAMAALDHPNIVPVYAIGQQGNFHYFVMKFLEGHTVSELLEQMRADGRRRFEPEAVQRILVQVCRGLGHAHARGLIHRDIKPGNIMVSPDGHVTIMDFGIVKEESGSESLTRTGLVFGTPEYMAPEQAQGHVVPGPATDLYSLGVVAYEMLSGVPPFRGDTPFSVVLKHIKEPPEPLVDRIPGVNAAFQQAIFRALEKKPEARYASAEEMLRAIESIDVDVLEMDDDLLLSGDEPSSAGSSFLSAAAAGRSADAEESIVRVTRTPAVRPAPPPPPPSEITSLPPPGHIPGRALPTERVEPRATPKPAPRVPVAEARPPAAAAPRDDPALVDDRPGHYRGLTTARTGRGRARARRRIFLVGGLVTLIGLTGIALIVFALARPSGSASTLPSPAGAPPGGDAGAAPAAGSSVEGADAGALVLQPTSEPTDAGDPDRPERVRLTILSEPVSAEVFLEGESRPLGTTPYVLRAVRADEVRALTLRREGYVEKKLGVRLSKDAVYNVRLEPVQ